MPSASRSQDIYRMGEGDKSIFGGDPGPAGGAYDAPPDPSRMVSGHPSPRFLPLDAFGVSISRHTEWGRVIGHRDNVFSGPRCGSRRACLYQLVLQFLVCLLQCTKLPQCISFVIMRRLSWRHCRSSVVGTRPSEGSRDRGGHPTTVQAWRTCLMRASP